MLPGLDLGLYREVFSDFWIATNKVRSAKPCLLWIRTPSERQAASATPLRPLKHGVSRQGARVPNERLLYEAPRKVR